MYFSYVPASFGFCLWVGGGGHMYLLLIFFTHDCHIILSIHCYWFCSPLSHSFINGLTQNRWCRFSSSSSENSESTTAPAAIALKQTTSRLFTNILGGSYVRPEDRWHHNTSYVLSPHTATPAEPMVLHAPCPRCVRMRNQT